MNNKTVLMALLAGFAVCAGISEKAHAGYFDDSIETTEAAEAMARCADEAKQLFPTGLEHMSEVTGHHVKVSERVDEKTYTFESYRGGAIFGPPLEKVASVTATVTVTQPPAGMMDAPSMIHWTCSVSK
jgi:hypothetical protein